MLKFCKTCGRPLNISLNKRYNGTSLEFCNGKCKQSFIRNQREKNKRKYGLGGWIYAKD